MKRFSLRNEIRQSVRVLFTDGEHFNKDITGAASLSDIKDWFSIRGRLYLKARFSHAVVYRLADSMYEFELRFLDY